MSGWRLPRFRGRVVLDGGFTDNIPTLGDLTLAVSPFAGDAAICPEDETVCLRPLRFPLGSGGSVNISRKNVLRFRKAMIPPNSTEMLAQCRQGWSDARRFLLSEQLVRCKTCSQSESSGNCQDCAAICEEARARTLPAELVKIFEEVRELELRQIW